MHIIFTVLGLDQSQYTLAERSTFYSLRLRLLSPANTLTLGKPRLRLSWILGTASGKNIYKLYYGIVVMLFLFFTVYDFRVVSSDILITSAAGLNVAVTISDDGIAGEPREMFTITSQPPPVSGSSDAQFLFRDSVINIIDSDGELYFLVAAWYCVSHYMYRVLHSIFYQQHQHISLLCVTTLPLKVLMLTLELLSGKLFRVYVTFTFSSLH